jgi:hypothetical protein
MTMEEHLKQYDVLLKLIDWPTDGSPLTVEVIVRGPGEFGSHVSCIYLGSESTRVLEHGVSEAVRDYEQRVASNPLGLPTADLLWGAMQKIAECGPHLEVDMTDTPAVEQLHIVRVDSLPQEEWDRLVGGTFPSEEDEETDP